MLQQVFSRNFWAIAPGYAGMLLLATGGGGSHRRTRLCAPFPCFAGKYREIRRFQPKEDHNTPCSQWKFNGLSVDFPKRQNREDFCAIRERKLDNRERSTASRGTVHIAPAKLATHHRLKQNGSVLNPRSHGLIRKKATLLASRPQGVEYPWEKAMKAKGRRGRVFIDKNAEGKATGWSLPTAILAIITGLVLGVIAIAWSAISVWLGW